MGGTRSLVGIVVNVKIEMAKNLWKSEGCHLTQSDDDVPYARLFECLLPQALLPSLALIVTEVKFADFGNHSTSVWFLEQRQRSGLAVDGEYP